jgi:hypothetical protein
MLIAASRLAFFLVSSFLAPPLLERLTETNHGAYEQHGPDGCHSKELRPDDIYSCIPDDYAGAKFHIVRGWGELHYNLEESGHRLKRACSTAEHGNRDDDRHAQKACLGLILSDGGKKHTEFGRRIEKDKRP